MAKQENKPLVSIPLIPFQVNINTKAAIFFISLPLFLFCGLYTANNIFDVRGCLQHNKQQEVVKEENNKQIAETLPQEWRAIYGGIKDIYFDQWYVLKKSLKDVSSHSMPILNDEQMSLFAKECGVNGASAAVLIIEKMKRQ